MSEPLYQAVRGTKDILPEEIGLWQYLESSAREIFHLFNYKEIRTPVFEETTLFARSIGDETDIVGKEMYTFMDKGERSLTLRPEGTAGVVRSYLENKLYASGQLQKLYYVGPMFRYERPQAGRQRQFHQLGVEAIGSDDPRLDAESIALCLALFTQWGLKDLSVQLNSVGCAICRPDYQNGLKNFLKDHVSELCEDCQKRYEKNPLRILDCKSTHCQAVLKNAPSILNSLCDGCKTHLTGVEKHLQGLNISYELNSRLVRGLDYYTRTAFEIQSPHLGSQNTIGAGGRYNNLVEQLGGESTPAVGFAIGSERVILALQEMKESIPLGEGLDLYFVAMGEKAQEHGFVLLDQLRRAGFLADMDYQGRGMKAQMKQADRLKAKFTLVLGDYEIENSTIQVKNMETGLQEMISLEGVIPWLMENMGAHEDHCHSCDCGGHCQHEGE